MNNHDEFYHHGIKGMKWGVRNGPPYPLDENLNTYKIHGNGAIEIKKGTELQRLVGKNRKQNLAGITYASFTQNDNHRYIVKLVGKGKFQGRDTKLVLKAKEDLKSPSTAEGARIFFNMLKDNPDINAAYAKTPLLRGTAYTKESIDNILKDPDKYSDYGYAVSSFMFPEMDPVRDAFFKELKKNGYNMLRDENDVRNGYAKNPIILLDGEKSASLESSTFITKEMQKNAKAYDKETMKLGKKWLKEHGFKEDVLLE